MGNRNWIVLGVRAFLFFGTIAPIFGFGMEKDLQDAAGKACKRGGKQVETPIGVSVHLKQRFQEMQVNDVKIFPQGDGYSVELFFSEAALHKIDQERELWFKGNAGLDKRKFQTRTLCSILREDAKVCTLLGGKKDYLFWPVCIKHESHSMMFAPMWPQIKKLETNANIIYILTIPLRDVIPDIVEDEVIRIKKALADICIFSKEQKIAQFYLGLLENSPENERTYIHYELYKAVSALAIQQAEKTKESCLSESTIKENPLYDAFLNVKETIGYSLDMTADSMDFLGYILDENNYDFPDYSLCFALKMGVFSQTMDLKKGIRNIFPYLEDALISGFKALVQQQEKKEVPYRIPQHAQVHIKYYNNCLNSLAFPCDCLFKSGEFLALFNRIQEEACKNREQFYGALKKLQEEKIRIVQGTDASLVEEGVSGNTPIQILKNTIDNARKSFSEQYISGGITMPAIPNPGKMFESLQQAEIVPAVSPLEHQYTKLFSECAGIFLGYIETILELKEKKWSPRYAKFSVGETEDTEQRGIFRNVVARDDLTLMQKEKIQGFFMEGLGYPYYLYNVLAKKNIGLDQWKAMKKSLTVFLQGCKQTGWSEYCSDPCNGKQRPMPALGIFQMYKNFNKALAEVTHYAELIQDMLVPRSMEEYISCMHKKKRIDFIPLPFSPDPTTAIASFGPLEEVQKVLQEQFYDSSDPKASFPCDLAENFMEVFMLMHQQQEQYRNHARELVVQITKVSHSVENALHGGEDLQKRVENWNSIIDKCSDLANYEKAMQSDILHPCLPTFPSSQFPPYVKDSMHE